MERKTKKSGRYHKMQQKKSRVLTIIRGVPSNCCLALAISSHQPLGQQQWEKKRQEKTAATYQTMCVPVLHRLGDEGPLFDIIED